MNIKLEAKDFSILWKEKSDYFHSLFVDLLICSTYLMTPALLKGEEKSLPHTTDDFLPPFPFPKRPTRKNCLSSLKTIEDLLPDLVGLKIERRGLLYNHVIFMYLGTFCFSMANIFNYLSLCDRGANDIEIIERAEKFGYEVTKEVYESIGYYTAKIEEKRKLIKSASPTSEERLQNKEMMRKLLKKTDNKKSQQFILEAMKRLDRGERSVKNLIKEIEAEEDNGEGDLIKELEGRIKEIQDKMEK